MTLSNQGPISPEIIQDGLQTRFKEQLDRLAELKAAFERFPATVEDEEVASKSVVFEKMLGAFITDAEKHHKAEKAQYLEAGRIVDAFFLAGMSKIVDPMKRTVNQRRVAYQDKVAQAQKAAALKAAQEAEEAAKKLAESMQTEADLSAAIDKVDEALNLKSAVENFSASDSGRLKTEYGVTASLTYEWVGEIDHMDVMDLAPLRAFIPADALQKALNQWIRLNKANWKDDDKPHIHGCKIYRKAKSVAR